MSPGSTAAPDLLSIVVPVLNEETNIVPFHERIAAVGETLDVGLELIFVDDGSTDRTCEVIRDLRNDDDRVNMIRLSRNFGSHPALTAGLLNARGDAAVLISVDLQDPPELITSFVEQWRQGYHVVWGVRDGRDDPWAKKTLANLFYALLRRVAALSFLYASFLIFRRVVFGQGGAGWPSVMVAILFLGGVQLIMLGILGEYIWRTSDQVRGRPLYIVMEQLGWNEGAEPE